MRRWIMAKTGRPGLSREKRAELWERWKSGQCASDIARALARTKGAIHHVLAFNGGIAPVARRRCPVALVLAEPERFRAGSLRGLVAALVGMPLCCKPSAIGTVDHPRSMASAAHLGSGIGPQHALRP